jgi:N6-adenosine-specific RNA methylase IME4
LTSKPQAQGSMALTRYDSACRALAEAVRVDEVKDIHDQAKALEEYAKQARDPTLMDHATDIRLRAERRAGELLHEMAKNRGARPGKTGRKARPLLDDRPKLADLGVSKTQSSRWQKLADLDEGAFESKVTRTKRIAVASVEGDREVIREARADRVERMRCRREHHERALAGKIKALPSKRYGVILADPEWKFEFWGGDSAMLSAAANHYATSTLDVIKTRDVQSIAADDCVLFLWATAPMMPHALEVMTAWGFAYKTQMVWGKDRAGTGYWFRNKHELLLVGTRGKVPCPAAGTQWDSLILAPRGEHSAKPECFLEMIEQYFPTVPKIELNRRGAARSGWDAWGAEVEIAAATITAEMPAACAQAPATDATEDDIPAFLDRRSGAPS